MKKIIVIALITLCSSSCRNAWNETDDASFRHACIDEAKTWAGSPERAEAYCNCIIPKIKEKYPDENEAMQQINQLISDKDLQACRDSLK